MAWELLINQTLIAGAILSGVLTVLIVISLKINPEIWYNDYPKEVQEAHGPMSDLGKRQRTPFAILLFGVMIGGLAWNAARIAEITGGIPPFLVIFLSASVVFLMFSLVDAFIIDWLILMVLWPSLGVLPGTEGMDFYHDMRAWRIALFKSIPISFFVGLLTAGVTILVMWIGSLL